MPKIEHLHIKDYVTKADYISDTSSMITDKIEEVNKKINKVNKKILEVEKLIPKYKVGDRIITKKLRIVTIEKIDYKKKLGYMYGGLMNFQPDDYMVWFSEDEFLQPYKNVDDYEYKLVARVLDLENEIERMKRK